MGTITEPSTQATTLTYDARGRVATRADGVGTITYGYDPNSNLLTVTQNGVTITRTYDALDRVTSYNDGRGHTLAYGYDANGNLTALTYEAGKTVTYTYDERNRLTGITDWTGRTTALAYDGAGRLLTLTRPNGTVRANTWDAASQLTAVMDKHTASGNPVLALKLGYDAAGRLTDKFEVPHIGANVTLPVRAATYNLDNQIVSQTIGGVARTITSDADGNITSAPAPDGTSTLQTYGWNTRNQLTSAPGGLTYSYDAEGLRASTTQGGQTTTFVNDPHGPMSRVLWRIRPDGTRTFYIHGPVLLYEIEESASGGNPANAARFYHYDHLGSTIALSNDDGQPVARANYSAYGILIGSTGTLNTPFQWQGAFGVQTDPNGLHNMRARYYHCYMGRFISEDPIGLSGGPNTFTYANGNPISSNDPTGLWTWGGFFSVALDFVPVVGTIKSAVELATGYDYIAGESVNRGAAGVGLAASLIPGGKAVAKGGVQVLGTGAKHADEAVDLAKVVAREGEGVVYRRINPATGAEYVGQSIDSANYAIRQTRHDGRIGITHSYEVIATGRTKRDLDVLEEAYIRSEGGLLREGGLLENARHQMNPTRFVNETNSLLRQYQGTLLMQNGLLNGGTRSIK